ncbi:hypothetical protein [Mucilaginibacter sp. dw_454]|uniref:hypothetical protein n=1 Tax=Mucilaginibacter sp. dw_454 TaxID=2720079 RepID=UPI001BD4C4C2|nr:hypothetical protein [Mucilaginibacter sp. dw_454]
MSFINKRNTFLLAFCFLISLAASAQSKWIRPDATSNKQLWGIHDGIVFSLWPNAVETGNTGSGGPRGLIQVGYEYKGKIYLINYIAIEPIVDGKIEFSEISPSATDGKWGKLLWASDKKTDDAYNPSLKPLGVITHPDPAKPAVEQLTLFVFMEQYSDKAAPYLKISIRSDRPEEICFEINNKANSARMDRCALTATMGNYSRLRLLHLNNEIVDSRKLYSNFNGIDFIEKQSYPVTQFLKLKDGSPIALAEQNESLAELTSWPTDSAYQTKKGWRYRPDFKLTQYWRKDNSGYDPSLQVRVNGRAKYWAGASPDPKQYVNLPGGPAFENFELREKYYPGQKFIYGLSRKSVAEILKE